MLYEPPAIYGIIGNPVAHSLSPVMHNTAFKALEVNAVYKLFPLADREELKLFMEDLKETDNPIRSSALFSCPEIITTALFHSTMESSGWIFSTSISIPV